LGLLFQIKRSSGGDVTLPLARWPTLIAADGPTRQTKTIKPKIEALPWPPGIEAAPQSSKVVWRLVVEAREKMRGDGKNTTGGAKMQVRWTTGHARKGGVPHSAIGPHNAVAFFTPGARDRSCLPVDPVPMSGVHSINQPLRWWAGPCNHNRNHPKSSTAIRVAAPCKRASGFRLDG
jgi:hypothetical protein